MATFLHPPKNAQELFVGNILIRDNHDNSTVHTVNKRFHNVPINLDLVSYYKKINVECGPDNNPRAYTLPGIRWFFANGDDMRWVFESEEMRDIIYFTLNTDILENIHEM